jgi:hypothetical protein
VSNSRKLLQELQKSQELQESQESQQSQQSHVSHVSQVSRKMLVDITGKNYTLHVGRRKEVQGQYLRRRAKPVKVFDSQRCIFWLKQKSFTLESTKMSKYKSEKDEN